MLTPEQIEQALALPAGTITLDRPAEMPAADEPFRIHAEAEPAGGDRYRVTLTPATPHGHW